MTTECPVCKKEYANRYIQAHITREAKSDEAHKQYRASHKPSESQSEPYIMDQLAQLEMDLQKNWNKIEVVTGERGKGMSQIDSLYKEMTSQMAESASKSLEEIPQSTNPVPPRKILVRKVKVVQAKHWYERSKPKKIKMEKIKVEKPKDPEDLLDLLTAIPAIVIVLALAYKSFVAVFTWNFSFFIGWTNSDIAQIYFWVLANPSQAVSIIILSLTAILVAVAIFLVHRLIWRLCFKDLQVRYLKKDATTGELRAVGSSRIGRMYLTIGRGFWDRLYRRLAKKPVPDTVTIYFKRRGFVNPFKVLASCEKGYLKDPDHSMFVIDGLFKRTLIATRLRRDTENNSTVYWFEGGDYATISFDSKWYEDTHREEIQAGLNMVGKACGMDSSIQKEQMKTSISFMPTDLLAEQKRIWELKKAKMQKAQPELTR